MRLNLKAAGIALALVGAVGAGPANAADKMALVLLHGGGSSGSQFFDMRPIIEKAGYRLITPDMCWSQNRRYEKDAMACMEDVDKAINKLKSEGFERIVLGGHSMGGINAILYAAHHTGLAGIVVFAPSGPPTGTDRTNPTVSYAHDLIRQGKGEDIVLFGGGINEIHASANAYLSYTGMESPLYDLELLPKITTPILWVAGTKDPGQNNATDRFKVAPPHRLNSFIRVVADHFETPDVAVGDMIKWLDRLAEDKGQG